MKHLFLFLLLSFFAFSLKSKITLQAKTIEEKDLSCIILLKLTGEKSKENGEMIKYEKLKKLMKSFQDKYEDNHFSEKITKIQLDKHNLKIKEKGQRYINKGLQRCGLK